MSNPNTDPHTFEASPAVAREISRRQADRAERRRLRQLGDHDRERRPERRPQGHQRPAAARPAGQHAQPAPVVQARPRCRPWPTRSRPTSRQIDPAHASYYKANAATFIASLTAWNHAPSRRSRRPTRAPRSRRPSRWPTTCSRPSGADNLTPWTFQADIMNGTDPSPQDVAIEKSLFTQHKVKVFLYNQQVTDSLTESFISWRTPTASRSSASTRPCRPPATTTSPGCSPRSTP